MAITEQVACICFMNEQILYCNNLCWCFGHEELKKQSQARPSGLGLFYAGHMFFKKPNFGMKRKKDVCPTPH